jgi:predicted flap endonuclease-1-like 5' DNA nuclease/chromosome segregation ATPase
MRWFFIQSLLALLAAFSLGIPIGYLMWRLQYRKVRTMETTETMGAGDVSLFRNEGSAVDLAQPESRLAISGAEAATQQQTQVGAGRDAASLISVPSVAVVGAAGPSVDRLRVEHAAEMAKLRSLLSDQQASADTLRVQLEALRKSVVERDAQIDTLKADAAKRGQVGASSSSADAGTQARLQTLAEQRDAARAGLAKALGEYETRLNAVRGENDRELESLRTEHKASLERLNADAESRINEIRTEREKVAQALQNAVAETDQQRASLQSRHEGAIADLRKRAERAEAELSTVRADLESQRAELARVQSTFQSQQQSLREELDAARGAAQSAEQSRQGLVGTNQSLESQVLDATAAASSANAELTNVQIELSTMKTELNTARFSLEEARAANVSAQSEVSRLGAALAAATARVGSDSAELASVKASLDDANSKLDRLQSEHALLNDRYQTLLADERSLRASVVASQTPPPGTAPRHSTLGSSATPLTSPRISTASGESVAAVESAPAVVPNLSAIDPEGEDLGSEGDDLERIEGIGPRISASLQAVGIRTFSRLAVAKEERLRAALARAGLNLAPSLPTWSQQARFLAMGDEASFRHLVEQLIAGREVK